MKAATRRKLEMGTRALEFSRAHPDESAGYTAALAQLEEQVTRSAQLATQQREGTVEVRAASARKRDLQRAMRRRQLVHLARATQRAARELPELAQKFALPRDPIPYLAFTTLARSMVAEAQRQKELLVRRGLVERVLDSLGRRSISSTGRWSRGPRAAGSTSGQARTWMWRRTRSSRS